MDTRVPLAARMRPASFEELAGQGHLFGPGKALTTLIESGRLPSLVLWGPPGSGKTTLAHLLAKAVGAELVQLSAVSSGVADARKVIKSSSTDSLLPTVLFVDEVHRWSKSQQDVLLPAVESGAVTLIGATTENPYFSLVSPLLSRSLLLRLEPLTPDELRSLIERALQDDERGLGELHLKGSEEALDYLVEIAGGDARVALTALEAAALATSAAGEPEISRTMAEEAAQKKAIAYDRQGDMHYDVISAFIKSMKASDPDAALFWLARMLEAGEDPRFIARRMVILASENVGLADPQALVVATAAAHAVEYVGMPEVQLNLAEAVVYLARAPKSDAVAKAIWEAMEDARSNDPVPIHLRDTHYPGAKKLGHGKGYVYPQEDPEAAARMRNRPERFDGKRYYTPTGIGQDVEVTRHYGE
ncbi:MAG: replication-associated recombination protein A, partial [Actinobacteria bacterium]|nr:replication-associated recombination protein A [Actinomycetota bacterium]